MYEIKCPKCGEVFQIEKEAYAYIVDQVRNEQFASEVSAQVEANRKTMAAEQKTQLALMENQYKEKIQVKENEIFELKEQAKTAAKEKELAVTEAVQKKEQEISRLNLDLQQAQNKADNDIRILNDNHKREMEYKDDEIKRLKEYKLSLNNKMVGESLEVYCKQQFDAVRMMAFRNAYFEKDNDDKEGSKADFIYREEAEDGTPLLSITFEMKNEMDATEKKQTNAGFLKKLDADRTKNKTEYAVLVTMLEQDNELYNTGIVAAYQYPKMYIVRPNCFIQLISLLRDAALNNLQTRRELNEARRQNLDVQNFEDALLDFKTRFDKDCRLAGKSFEEAITRIDESIKQMQLVKDALTNSKKHLEWANNKTQDLSIKKLTKNSPSVQEKFLEAGVEIK